MGNRIRELRKAKGLTMKQLGEVLDLAESTISQYETGKRQMDNETLLRLGEFFEVSVGYILGAEDNAKAPTETGERPISDDDIKFALFRGREDITNAMFEEVLNFAEYVARREEERKRKE